MLKTMFGEEQAIAISQMQFADGTRFGAHPAIVELFTNLGAQQGEHEIFGKPLPSSFAVSPGEAQAEWARLKGDPDFLKKLLDKQHPEHQASQDRKSTLFAQGAEG